MIKGYQLKEKLYNDDHFDIYRGVNLNTQEEVVLKLPRDNNTLEKNISLLRHEYNILKQLQIPGIVQLIELVQNKQYALVLKKINGKSLFNYLQGKPVGIDAFFQFSIQLLDIVGKLHENNIIYKNFRSTTVFINENTLELTDFSLASQLSEEIQEYSTDTQHNIITAYSAPEQTGRINRPIDYRTDYYALGALFFELLTGRLPFITDDRLELIHYIIAKQAPLVTEFNSSVPPMLAAIVAKLLSKMSEERYNSIIGLRADLSECMEQWKQQGKIKSFPIGKKDINDHLTISHRLYGRDEQVQDLFSAFSRVSQGSSELVLITGYSGVGKTSVVKEVHKPIVQQRGYFIEGKFDQLQSTTPFSALVDAFKDLVKHVLSESEIHLDKIKNDLLEALDNLGQIIVDVIPDVELIIGKQPRVPALNTAETQNRFNLVFQKFVQVFAQQNHPIVIFLDDLQWADGASLQFIENLLINKETHHLLIIGAYRSNEVDSSHPLEICIRNLKNENVTLNTITLLPIGLKEIQNLLSDTLSTTQEIVQSFAEVLFQKTQGNPFFINIFLKMLYQEGLLTFSYKRGVWQWNIDKIRQQPVTDNVIDLLTVRIHQLSPATQNILKLAACFGHRFSIKVLTIVSQQIFVQTAQQLWEAIQANLIIHLDEIYKTTTLLDIDPQADLFNNLDLNYRFAHDRIQQAAYQLIPKNSRKKIHLNIGRLLLEEHPLTEQDDRLFEIVEHFNHSLSLISDKDEKYKLAIYNFWAGKKAKSSTAYKAANKYLQSSVKLLEPLDWKTNYDLIFTIIKDLAVCKYLSGEFQDAETYFQLLQENSNNILDEIEIYRLNCEMLSTMNKHAEAIQLGLRALKILNINLPNHPKDLHVLKTIFKIQFKIGRRKIKDIQLEPIKDPKQKATIDLITQLFNNAFIINQKLFALLTCTNIYLTLNYGYTESNAMSFPVYAFVIMHSLNLYREGIDFVELNNRLTEKYGVSSFEGKNKFILGAFIDPWRWSIKDCPAVLTRAFQLTQTTGDLVYAHYSNLLLVNTGFFSAKSLTEIRQCLQQTINFAKKSKIRDFMTVVEMWEYLVQCLEQKKEFSQNQLLKYEQRVIQNLSKTELCFFYSYSTKFTYLLGNLNDAIRYGKQYAKYSIYGRGMINNAEFLFYYALSMTNKLTTVSNKPSFSERVSYTLILRKLRRQLKRWATWCQINFEPYLLLLDAELAAINNKIELAIESYEKAIKSSQEQNTNYLTAIANECLGRFYLTHNISKLAAFYFSEACSIFKAFGAIEKCKLLEQTYPDYFNIAKNIPRINEKMTSDTPAPISLDMLAILKSTEIISSEIRLDRLRKKLLLVVLEIAGAERGIILVKSSTRWLIEAEGGIDQQIIYLSTEEQVTSKSLPLSLMNYVQRTMQPIIVPEATQSQFTLLDPYIQESKPRSMLMLPISYQGQLSRILYLENKKSSHVFTMQNLQSLQLIASSAMISLENARLYHQASHDSLTGLANRNLLDQIFKVAASQASRLNKQIVIFFIDLDNFKTINDTLGHEIGDRLLVYVTEKISGCLREGDIAARLGGDEFAIMLMSIDDIRQITDIADRLLQNITEPVMILGHQVQITFSMGICLYPKDASDIQTLLKLADIALYQAKEYGKNQYHFYSESLQEQYRSLHLIETELQQAIERNEFRIYYQPIIDIKSKKLISFEALLRWQHPYKGLLQAKDFIQILEKKSLILPVSEWIIVKICEQAKIWQNEGLLHVPIAINTTAAQFTRQSLSKLIGKALKKTRLESKYIELELTESTFIGTNKRVLSEIKSILNLGVKLVIDDFGAGYSSLGYLKRLPVSKIKIDSSYFVKSEDNDFNLIIVDAITALAHQLKLEVIAEGIETNSQFALARKLGVDAIQGYYFSYPLSPEECEKFLKKAA